MTEDRADTYDELVREFYGINPETFKPDSVAITQRGKLSQWTDRGYRIRRLKNTDLLAEVQALTGLIDLIDVDPKTPNSERRKMLADLTKKALEMLENRREKDM